MAWEDFKFKSKFLHGKYTKRRGKMYIEDVFAKWNYPEIEEAQKKIIESMKRKLKECLC